MAARNGTAGTTIRLGTTSTRTSLRSYRDPAEAWDALTPYFEYHSHLGDLPVITSLDWLDPLIVGPRIGKVDMVEHNLAMPEIEGIHIADQ